MSNSPQQKTRRHTRNHSRVPSLRHHKASGQAYVVLNGKAIYLSCEMVARIPLRAVATPTVAYAYYQPDQQAVAAQQVFVVD